MAVAAVRTLVFTVLFYAGSIPLIVVAVALAASPRAVAWLARAWSTWFALTSRVVLGIACRVTGEIPRGRVLIAVKHQAAYETLMLPRLIEYPAAVIKAELLAIPVWATAARAYGVIPIERGESASALRNMLRAARAAIAAGRPVVIFPEGTRTAPGEAPPLRSGLAGLYRALGVPLVPVAVMSAACWPKGFVKYPGVVDFVFGTQIEPGLDRAEVEARVHAAINALNAA